MKTIEEKAKAYDGALERAKAYHRNELAGSRREMTEYIFPELAESEDEKIRKGLIKILDRAAGSYVFEATGIMKDACLAWLEKQKESLHTPETCKENVDSFTSEDERIRKAILGLTYLDGIEPILTKCSITAGDIRAYLERQKVHTEGDFARGYDSGYEACLNSHGAEWFEKQKEQKPAWSEEDKEIIDKCIDAVSFAYADGETKTKCASFLQSLRPQPKQEWSEKEEKILDSLIRLYSKEYSAYAWPWANGAFTYGNVVNFLESLRPSWKPTQEQMKILNWAANGMVDKCIAAPEMRAILRELYDDLKRL